GPRLASSPVFAAAGPASPACAPGVPSESTDSGSPGFRTVLSRPPHASTYLRGRCVSAGRQSALPDPGFVLSTARRYVVRPPVGDWRAAPSRDQPTSAHPKPLSSAPRILGGPTGPREDPDS